MRELVLALGDARIGLVTGSAELRDMLAAYFMQEGASGRPDIRLRIVETANLPFDLVPDSLFHAKRPARSLAGRIFGWEDFAIEGGTMRGRFDGRRGRGVLAVHPVLLRSEASRVFEQILYQAYASALGAAYDLAPLVHSSGVVRNGKGYLFLGRSEAGKSTVAGMSSEFTVINDEITLPDCTGSVPLLRSTPFNGLFRGKSEASAPLAGIFLLEKDSVHAVEPVSGAEALKTVAQQIIPPLGLDQYMSTEIFLRQLDIAKGLFERVPVRRLRFRKDPGFWAAIDSGATGTV